jgi:hypothetical protein
MSYSSDECAADELWARYVDLELSGQRVQALEALEPFIQALLARGVEFADSWSLSFARLMGHSDIATTMRYMHLAPVHHREAIQLLEATTPRANGSGP